MKKSILFPVLILFIGISILGSCKKEETKPNPSISFLTDEGYTFSDVTLPAGDTVIIGLNCQWNGTDLLTAINVLYNDIPAGTTTISPAVEQGIFTTKIVKNGAATEKYTFELVDAGNQKSSVSITLTKDATGNVPSILTNITIGAQNSTSHDNFYSISTQITYDFTEASANPGVIDFIGAYDATNELHLTSPGANLSTIPEYSTIANWSPKNTTYFCYTGISTEQYNLIDRDQFFIDMFNSFPDEEQKKKAKSLKVNDVYVFKTQAGKYGILIVKSVSSDAAGYVTFDAKIQP